MVESHLRHPPRVGVMQTLPGGEDHEIPDALVGIRRMSAGPKTFDALDVGAVDQTDGAE